MILHRITSAALLTGMVATAYISNSTFEAPLAPWAQEDGDHTMDTRPDVEVTWDDSYDTRFPGCAPKLDQEFPDFLAKNLQGEVAVYSFDEGWERTHNEASYDDLWIVGQCAGR